MGPLEGQICTRPGPKRQCTAAVCAPQPSSNDLQHLKLTTPPSLSLPCAHPAAVFVGLTACIGSANANRLRTYLMLMASAFLMPARFRASHRPLRTAA